MLQLPTLVNPRVPLKVGVQRLASNILTSKLLSYLSIELEASTVIGEVQAAVRAQALHRERQQRSVIALHIEVGSRPRGI